MPPTIMNSNICNVCFFSKLPVKTIDLKTCSHCKLISYCGIEHQKLDWPIHKDFCRAVRTVMEKNAIKHPLYIAGKIVDKNDLEKAIMILKNCLIFYLKRTLYTHEDELITFPRFCNVCLNFKTDATVNCESCNSVNYCSLKCKSSDSSPQKHLKICHKLKMLYNFYEDDNEIDLKLNCKWLDLPMDNFKNVVDYLENFLSKDIKIAQIPNSFDEYQNFATAALYSSVSTILYVLTYFKIVANYRKSCTIYIVGVRDDYLWFQEPHCKFLISQMPNVKYLKLIFIGPELKTNKFHQKYFFNIDDEIKTVELNMYCEKFEKYLEIQNLSIEKEIICNLLICFNCGFAEYANTPYHTWALALKYFVNMKRTPIAFTSYTLMESKLDLKEILSATNDEAFNILIRTADNPFKDLRPLRNWEITDLEDDLVFHRNGYLNLIVSQ